MEAPGSARIDIVTVVFAGELSLLRLQARSFARFMPEALVGKIIVIVNDRKERHLEGMIRSILAEYGVHERKVEIVRPDELCTWQQDPIFVKRLEGVLVTRVLPIFERLKSAIGRSGSGLGWRGISGWRMQQAFKLMAARRCVSQYVLIFDAKNHLIAPVSASTFIERDGRPRSRVAVLMPYQESWLMGSFSRLRIRPSLPLEVPPTVTPCVLRREDLSNALTRIEDRLGPLELFFAWRKRKESEFMLLFAILDEGQGHWWRLFSKGLPPPLTAFGSYDSAKTGNVLARAKSHASPFLGLHRAQISKNPEMLAEFQRFWVEIGLCKDLNEAERIVPGPREKPCDPIRQHRCHLEG